MQTRKGSVPCKFVGSRNEPVPHNTVRYQKHSWLGSSTCCKVLNSYLPVFWAFFCDSHSVIQSNNTAGFLQIFHAASESRCRNVKPDLGYKKGRDVPDQACLRAGAETLCTVSCFSPINECVFYGYLLSWDFYNTTYFVKLRKSTSFLRDSAFSALEMNIIVLTEEWPVSSKRTGTDNVRYLELLPTFLPR